jgi:hypothetical protein
MYHKKKPLVFATSQMFAPFGLNEYENTGRFSLNLSFPEGDDSLMDKIKEIEARIIDEAFKESKTWFKKTFASREDVAEMFTSCVKYPKERNGEIASKYRPTMQLNVPYKNNSFECQAFNTKRECFPITKESVGRGTQIEAITQCSCIWMSTTKITATMKVMQMKVAASRNGTVVYTFVEDEDDVNID